MKRYTVQVHEDKADSAEMSNNNTNSHYIYVSLIVFFTLMGVIWRSRLFLFPLALAVPVLYWTVGRIQRNQRNKWLLRHPSNLHPPLRNATKHIRLLSIQDIGDEKPFSQ